jgi:stage V sporulation protein G
MINGMEITDAIIFPIKKVLEDSKLKAFARVVFNDQLIISGIRIFEGKNGPFISFPQEYDSKVKKGYDICYPITAEFRTYISEKVLEQYSLTFI